MRKLTCLLLAWLCTVSLRAQEPPSVPAVFTLTSDMLQFAAPSSRLFRGWQQDADALMQVGFDAARAWLPRDGAAAPFLRAGALSVFAAASLLVSQAFSLTAHDESHLEAARAIGSESEGFETGLGGAPLGVGGFFLEAFNPFSDTAIYWYEKPDATLAQRAFVAGEGLDTNMLMADAVAGKIRSGQGHVMDLAPYLLNKTWGLRYFLEWGPTSDGENYLGYLAESGATNATTANLLLLHGICCLASGGFLSLARGVFEYVREGRVEVPPLGLTAGALTIDWPELTTFLNPQSVSLCVTLDAAWAGFLWTSVALDTPVLGTTTGVPELTLGSHVKAGPCDLGAEITTGFRGFPFLEASARLTLTDDVSVGVEAFYGQKATMREMREHPLGPGAVVFLSAAPNLTGGR